MTYGTWMAIRRHVVAGVLLAAGLFAVVAVRLLLESRESVSQGAEYERNGKLTEAVAAYRDAARAYVPLTPYSAFGFERMIAIGKHGKEKGDLALARLAFESFRGAALATRSAYTPHSHELIEVQRHLAEIYAQWDRARAENPESARSNPYFAGLLQAPVGPSLGRSVAALVGLGIWISAVVVFLFLGLDSALRPRKPLVLTSGIAFALGVALFAWGLLGGGAA
jgi:hypothetical protein